MPIKETPIIRYSLKDRGRQHTGQPRNFNIKALYDSINGSACQETVASRGMTGYYGHMPRIRFGMTPVEGVFDNGKFTPVEHALVTTHLKIDENGVIEHKAEFLDTPSGRLAARLFDDKVGGWSSAIDQSKPEFHGFDYVIQPNFLANSFRGITMDDVLGGDLDDKEITLDDVYAAEQEEYTQGIIMLLDSIKGEREVSNETIERLQQENEQLISFLARHNVDPTAVLDTAGSSSHVMVDMNATKELLDDVNGFKNETLPQTGKREEAVIESKVYKRMLTRMTR
ncbi:hypothetical protein [Nitrosomonas marina]|uniref:Uncharacterized protein n=1 Tax=Nitrosomonas marina TaxID=917 RepID=A0A1H8IMN3_9PROT|nr:hypothetical protein [Nitrosomonas marina]SEN69649.1 hypothetical protein SAMN05216325_1363 [Nitrosomonas marina]